MDGKKATGLIGIGIGALLLPLIVVLVILGSQESAKADCSGVAPAADTGGGGVGTEGLDADQLENARLLVRKGLASGGEPAAVVGVTVALTESTLHTDPGSLGGAYGLMQQTPPTWGTVEQVKNPEYAVPKFYSVLLTVPGWERMEPWHAAQSVQRSGAGDANGNGVVDPGDGQSNFGPSVARAQAIVRELSNASDVTSECPANGAVGAITIASLNILGASHTDGRQGGGGLGSHESRGFPTWDVRLPRALSLLDHSGVTVAGLQEVHPPQSAALEQNARWGIYPRARAQNKVIWDRGTWELSESRTVALPYFHGSVPTPLVRLTSLTDGSSIWVWSVHNARRPANAARFSALNRQAQELEALKATGLPVFIVGDFNDGRDGRRSSHCAFTPLMKNAFGTGGGTCGEPTSPKIDHIYGANIEFDTARGDSATISGRIADHPLVVATTVAVEVEDAGGRGSGGNFRPSPIDHVGPYNRAELLARMQRFVNANGTGQLDPFFNSQSGSWHAACQHFVANLSGRAYSGYATANAGWAFMVSSGAAHPAGSSDGMAPPPGAWLYYDNAGPYGHVTVYLGNNQVAGTDTWGDGTVNYGPASDITNGRWHLTYLGWAAPWGQE